MTLHYNRRPSLLVPSSLSIRKLPPKGLPISGQTSRRKLRQHVIAIFLPIQGSSARQEWEFNNPSPAQLRLSVAITDPTGSATAWSLRVIRNVPLSGPTVYRTVFASRTIPDWIQIPDNELDIPEATGYRGRTVIAPVEAPGQVIVTWEPRVELEPSELEGLYAQCSLNAWEQSNP